MGAAASVIILPITGAIGYGLTHIKDTHEKEEILTANVKRITKVVETRKTARIFAGIFTLGLTELLNHRNQSVEYIFGEEYIGSSEVDAARALNIKGNECYNRGDYETAANFFADAHELTKNNEYKNNLDRTRQKIREEAEKQQREEAARIEQEEAVRRERDEAARKEQEEAMRREGDEAAKRKQEEAIRLQRIRTQSKSLLKEANNIYQQAEALISLELKLEKYEKALYKCEESCASDATEEAFETVNKIFESCLKHDAHDEAEGAVQIVRKYFPSEAARLQDTLVNQQTKSWCPDYESRQKEQEEQNKTIMMMLA